MARLARKRRTLKWADVTKAIRSSPWCSLPLAFGSLSLSYLILLLFGWTVVPVAIAASLFSAGFVIMGLRLFVYIQQTDKGDITDCAAASRAAR